MEAEVKKAKKAVEIEQFGDFERVVKLSKTYNFEGDMVSEIDLSGIEDLTAKSMMKAERALTAAGEVSVMPQNNLRYCLIIASECTQYPIEFYEMLNMKDATRVKNAITNFTFSGE